MTDREKLIELFNKFTFSFTQEEYYSGKVTNEYCIEQIADYLISNGVTIPVRCKDCKYYIKVCCVMTEGLVCPLGEWYCSHGERKEDER